MGSSKKQTIGYRYSFGLHMGLCRGPVDMVMECRVGDRTAWPIALPGGGMQPPATATDTFGIFSPKLFGGEKGEGGIHGTATVLMGNADQTYHPPLREMLGSYPPAYRGVTTVFYEGEICSMNPYPKPWKWRVRRTLQGWDGPVWHSGKARIWLADDTIMAMNGAHILYESQTDRSWGRGFPRARLDDAAYKAAADTLYNERFGLCLAWRRQDSLAEFQQSILDHIGAAQFVDRLTGLWTIKLIRADYNVNDLPLFTPDTGLLGIDEWSTSAPAQSTNQVIVNYRDPITNEDRQVRVESLAGISAAGGVAAETKNYPGIPTADLGTRVAQRDLAVGVSGLKRGRIRVDRRGYALQPASVIRLSDPDRGIANIVLRVVRVDHGPITEGTITLTVVQDVFGMPATSWVGDQPSLWIPPDRIPRAPTVRRLIELPYRDLLGEVDTATLEPDMAFIGTLAQRPGGLQMNYTVASRTGSVGDFQHSGSGDWTPTATLESVMLRGAAPVAVSLQDAVNLSLVEVGTAALINNEIFRVTAIDPAIAMVALARGCVDTVPAGHAAGSRVWFYEAGAGTDAREHSIGETVQIKLLSRTTQGELQESAAVTDSITLGDRQYRPYPPGNVKMNGAAYPAHISGELTISWAHRDRILQDDQLVDTQQGNVGPEPGTTYTLKIYGETNNLLRTVTGLTTTSYAYTSERHDSDLESVVIPAPPPETVQLDDGANSGDYQAMPQWGMAWVPTVKDYRLNVFAHDGSRFMATIQPIGTGNVVGSFVYRLLSSTDLQSWTLHQTSEQSPWLVQQNTGVFYAIHRTTDRYYQHSIGPASWPTHIRVQQGLVEQRTSTDLDSWSVLTGGPSTTAWSTRSEYLNLLWVAGDTHYQGELIEDGGDMRMRVWACDDGATWTYTDSDPLPASVRHVTPQVKFGDPVFINGQWYFQLLENRPGQDITNDFPGGGADPTEDLFLAGLYTTTDWLTITRCAIDYDDRQESHYYHHVIRGEHFLRYLHYVGGSGLLREMRWLHTSDGSTFEAAVPLADAEYPAEPDGQYCYEDGSYLVAFGRWYYPEIALPAPQWRWRWMRSLDGIEWEPMPVGELIRFESLSGGGVTALSVEPYAEELSSGYPQAVRFGAQLLAGRYYREDSGDAVLMQLNDVEPLVVSVEGHDSVTLNDPLQLGTALVTAPQQLPWPLGGHVTSVTSSGIQTTSGTGSAIVTVQLLAGPGETPTLELISPEQASGAYRITLDIAAGEVRLTGLNGVPVTPRVVVVPVSLTANTWYTITAELSAFESRRNTLGAFIDGGCTATVTVSDESGVLGTSTGSVSARNEALQWTELAAHAVTPGHYGEISVEVDKGSVVASRLNESLRIVLSAQRDGVTSLQNHDITVTRSET